MTPQFIKALCGLGCVRHYDGWIPWVYLYVEVNPEGRSDTRRVLFTRLSKGFLRLVGLEYVVIGLTGLVALFLQSSWPLILCGMGAMYLIVTPGDLMLEYGTQAACWKSELCNLSTPEMQHARTVIMTLCLFSVCGGIAGVWAASTRDKQAGRAVWLVLILVSVVVVAWSWKPLNWLRALPILWLAGYLTAYIGYLREAD